MTFAMKKSYGRSAADRAHGGDTQTRLAQVAEGRRRLDDPVADRRARFEQGLDLVEQEAKFPHGGSQLIGVLVACFTQ